jgi:hypothetical protein
LQIIFIYAISKQIIQLFKKELLNLHFLFPMNNFALIKPIPHSFAFSFGFSLFLVFVSRKLNFNAGFVTKSLF